MRQRFELYRSSGISALGRLDGKPDDALVARLGEHIANVEVDSAFCDSKLEGDFLVCLVVADALQDGKLAVGQRDVRAAEGIRALYVGVDLLAAHRGTDAVGKCLA